jgi:hypothetical protein
LFEIGLEKGDEIVLAGTGADDSALVVQPLPDQPDAKGWGMPEPAIRQ